MGSRLLVYLLVTPFLIVFQLEARGGPSNLYEDQSTYFGYMFIQGEKYPTEMNIIRESLSEESENLHVFLRAHMGGFGSHEYFSQYYKIEDYDFTDPRMSLNGLAPGEGPDFSLYAADPDAKVFYSHDAGRWGAVDSQIENSYYDASFHENGKFYRSAVRVHKHTYLVGVVELVRFESKKQIEKDLAKILPKYPVEQLLSGSYTSFCEQTRYGLELLVVKNLSSGQVSINPIPGHDVWGQLKGENFVNSSASMMTFDPFRNKASIPALRKLGENCEFSSGEIFCSESCRFVKATSDFRRERKDLFSGKKRWEGFHARTSPVSPEISLRRLALSAAPPVAIDFTSQGLYKGKMQLEERGVEQNLKIDVRLFNRDENQVVSPSTSVYVDTRFPEAAQAIVFHSPEIAIDENGNLNGRVISANENAKIYIKRWTADEIYGTWYTRMYGRVGDFIVSKSEANVEKIRDHSTWGHPVAGSYRLASSHSERLLDSAPFDSFKKDIYMTLSAADRLSVFPFTLGVEQKTSVVFGEGRLRQLYSHSSSQVYFDPILSFLAIESESGDYKEWMAGNIRRGHFDAYLFDNIALAGQFRAPAMNFGERRKTLKYFRFPAEPIRLSRLQYR